MLNSNKFRKIFSSIENHLRGLSGKDKSTRFMDLVDALTEKNPTVRSLAKDLKEYAELRNAIVHDYRDYVIAEPNEHAVNDIERIASLLLKPPLVFSLFQAKVKSLNSSDSISIAVKFMLEHAFSQIPISNGSKFSGLLTANTIARWLGAKVSDDIFSLEESLISEVMKYAEDSDNHVFMSRTSNVFEAIDLFQIYESRGKKLEAILITDSGQHNDKIIGIITLSDLPKAYAQINRLRG